jgi:hypothetical protein
MKIKPFVRLLPCEAATGPSLHAELQERLLERFGDSIMRRKVVMALAAGLAGAAAPRTTRVASLAVWWTSDDVCAALADVRWTEGRFDGQRWLLAKVRASSVNDVAFEAITLHAEDVATLDGAVKRLAGAAG